LYELLPERPGIIVTPVLKSLHWLKIMFTDTRKYSETVRYYRPYVARDAAIVYKWRKSSPATHITLIPELQVDRFELCLADESYDQTSWFWL